MQFIEEVLEHARHGLATGPGVEATGCGCHKSPMTQLQSQHLPDQNLLNEIIS
ncbi:MAG: hypothetical protein V4540_17540 [Pseudomonadota bacterium]